MDNQDMTYSYGYEFAKSEYKKLSTVPSTSQEWVAFFHAITPGLPVLEAICGVASFITSAEAKKINKGQFNKEIRSLGNAPKQYSEDANFVGRLLPKPDYYDDQGEAIEIPVDLRPDCNYDSFLDHGTGKLGRIYLKEMGMKAYFPHFDVYDPDDPDEIICEGALLDVSSVKASELLSALQQVLDPNKENQELSDTIDRCRQYESSSSPLVVFLKKYGIGVVNLSANGWKQINCGHIHDTALYAIVDDNDHIQVTLRPWKYLDERDNPFDATEAGFNLSDYIKEAINRARN
jgi:hypothetical protein